MDFDVRGYLNSLSRFGIKPGLERIRAILTRLGDPHKNFRTIHVGGTNGKGSTSAMITEILKTGGCRVGLYTSPHLVAYNERIQVQGAPIDDRTMALTMQEVAAAATEIKAELGTDPTEFEVGTAAAFLHFARAGVDIAVIEVGLGGRLDSTNVIDAEVIALSSISHDHTSILGTSLAQITREKTGIFRPGIPVVCSPQVAEVEAVIREEAAQIGAPIVWVREVDRWESVSEIAVASSSSVEAYFHPLSWDTQGGRVDVRTPWRKYSDLYVPLLGRHQLQNAAVALTVVDTLFHHSSGLNLPEVTRDDAVQGVARTRWPGRLELVPGQPILLLDGVHNPGGAQALARSLKTLFPRRRLVFVVALLGEKDAEATLAPLMPLASDLFVTRPVSARMEPASLQTLVRVAQRFGVHARAFDKAQDALVAARESAGADGVVCVCGSLYLIGEVKELLAKSVDHPFSEAVYGNGP